MLYRMVEHGDDPEISVVAESKDLGMVPTFNTIGEIGSAENPDEYVMLSAHFDSWDGGTGATDNGTGSILMMETMRILKKREPIETTFPGNPSGGGSDHASFVAKGAPAFVLGALSWDYFSYTWHTNRDTYDKIVFDDVQNNAILIAILVYKACEDQEKTSREKSVLPIDSKTGERRTWPETRSPTRKGGQDQ